MLVTSTGAKAPLIRPDIRGPFGELRAGSEGPLFDDDADVL